MCFVVFCHKNMYYCHMCHDYDTHRILISLPLNSWLWGCCTVKWTRLRAEYVERNLLMFQPPWVLAQRNEKGTYIWLPVPGRWEVNHPRATLVCFAFIQECPDLLWFKKVVQENIPEVLQISDIRSRPSSSAGHSQFSNHSSALEHHSVSSVWAVQTDCPVLVTFGLT